MFKLNCYVFFLWLVYYCILPQNHCHKNYVLLHLPFCSFYYIFALFPCFCNFLISAFIYSDFIFMNRFYFSNIHPFAIFVHFIIFIPVIVWFPGFLKILHLFSWTIFIFLAFMVTLYCSKFTVSFIFEA